MINERVVPQEIVNLAADCYSAMLLERGRGKTFAWNGKRWTCVGGVSRNLRDLEATIVEVVPPQLYKGKSQLPDGLGSGRRRTYDGFRFREHGGSDVWVMTSNQLRLIADEQVVTTVVQERQLELWGQA